MQIINVNNTWSEFLSYYVLQSVIAYGVKYKNIVKS